MWFSDLFGFAEEDPTQVRGLLEVRETQLRSSVNGRSYACGDLELPSLAELRARAVPRQGGRLRLVEVVGDVQTLHERPENAGAMFQAASQFNLLEMTSPNVTPEDGVGIYEFDHTQGPACAIACGAGTVYRNYFVALDDQVGQTADRQIDCLKDLGDALGNGDGALWAMRNGYALLTPEGLAGLGSRLALDAGDLDGLRALLRIGVHRGVEVTSGGPGHCVTQVYGSALPVAYGGGAPHLWAPLARLVLEASYEATVLAACENAEATGNDRVFLTLLGGGVFGNVSSWIFDALERALCTVSSSGLDVSIVSYGRSQAGVRDLVDHWSRGGQR